MALSVDVWSWKLFCRFPRTAFSIYFYRHLCYRMYCLATKDSECQHLVIMLTGTGNTAIGLKCWLGSEADFSLKLQISKYSCWPRLFQTIVCSYTVHHMQYDRLSQQQLSFFLLHAYISLQILVLLTYSYFQFLFDWPVFRVLAVVVQCLPPDEGLAAHRIPLQRSWSILLLH